MLLSVSVQAIVVVVAVWQLFGAAAAKDPRVYLTKLEKNKKKKKLPVIGVWLQLAYITYISMHFTISS